MIKWVTVLFFFQLLILSHLWADASFETDRGDRQPAFLGASVLDESLSEVDDESLRSDTGFVQPEALVNENEGDHGVKVSAQPLEIGS